MRPLRLILALCFLWTGLLRAEDPAPVVAAAADLRFALEEVAQRFRASTGQDLRLSFGASGQLARQIEAGAPFQVFLSADEALARRLEQAGLTQGTGCTYAAGRLALFLPNGSPLKLDATLKDLGTALKDGRLRKLALANPEHAPYGKRAMEALQTAGLWEALRPHLVMGENVSQAAEFTRTGLAQGGLIAHSLTLSKAFQGQGQAVLVPASMHAPLLQRMVLLRGAGPVATRFYAYLQSKEAREVMVRHGFTLPGT